MTERTYEARSGVGVRSARLEGGKRMRCRPEAADESRASEVADGSKVVRSVPNEAQIERCGTLVARLLYVQNRRS